MSSQNKEPSSLFWECPPWVLELGVPDLPAFYAQRLGSKRTGRGTCWVPMMDANRLDVKMSSGDYEFSAQVVGTETVYDGFDTHIVSSSVPCPFCRWQNLGGAFLHADQVDTMRSSRHHVLTRHLAPPCARTRSLPGAAGRMHRSI